MEDYKGDKEKLIEVEKIREIKDLEERAKRLEEFFASNGKETSEEYEGKWIAKAILQAEKVKQRDISETLKEKIKIVHADQNREGEATFEAWKEQKPEDLETPIERSMRRREEANVLLEALKGEKEISKHADMLQSYEDKEGFIDVIYGIYFRELPRRVRAMDRLPKWTIEDSLWLSSELRVAIVKRYEVEKNEKLLYTMRKVKEANLRAYREVVERIWADDSMTKREKWDAQVAVEKEHKGFAEAYGEVELFKGYEKRVREDEIDITLETALNRSEGKKTKGQKRLDAFTRNVMTSRKERIKDAKKKTDLKIAKMNYELGIEKSSNASLSIVRKLKAEWEKVKYDLGSPKRKLRRYGESCRNILLGVEEDLKALYYYNCKKNMSSELTPSQYDTLISWSRKPSDLIGFIIWYAKSFFPIEVDFINSPELRKRVLRFDSSEGERDPHGNRKIPEDLAIMLNAESKLKELIALEEGGGFTPREIEEGIKKHLPHHRQLMERAGIIKGEQ